MPHYHFGFNGFNAIPDSDEAVKCKEITKIELLESAWRTLTLSWSTTCYVSENRLNLSGFHGRQLNLDSIKDLKVTGAAVSDRFLAIITDSGLGKIYSFTFQGLVEVKHIELHKDKLLKCCAGESDVLFINEGKVIWISLKQKMEECLLPLAWKVKEVCCGKEHVMLLNEFGTVYSFGQGRGRFCFGSRGQLGHGTIESESSPCAIECLEGIPVRHIAAGGWHSAAVTMNGDLFTWGWNESGQLGIPTTRQHQSPADQETDRAVSIQALPTCVEFDEEVIIESVDCGARHTIVITSSGRVWAFGCNSYGQLGLPVNAFVSRPTLLKDFPPNDEVAVDVRCAGWTSVLRTKTSASAI